MSNFRIARHSIYLNATIDGRTHRFYPKITINKVKSEWNDAKQKFKGEGDMVVAINQFLTQFQKEVDTFILDAKRNGLSIAKNDLTDHLEQKFFNPAAGAVNKNSFLAYFKNQIETLSQSPGTIKTYVVTLNNLTAYLSTSKRTDVRFSEMDKRWFNDYENWLKIKGTSSISTIDKHKKILKTFLNKGLEEGLHTNIDFQKVKRAKRSDLAEDTIHLYLTEEEVESIANLTLTGDQLKVISAFCFSCYTGVRFEDTMNLTEENFIHKPNEGYWLSYTQAKTSQQVDVPIIKQRAFQLAKDNNFEFLKIANGKANDIIRKVLNDHALLQQKIKVNTTHTKGTFRKADLVSYHVSRKTFCTNAWLKGIPNNLIMAASGHKSEAVFLTYIKADQKQKAQGLLGYKDY